MITPRPYQTEAVQAIRKRASEGVMRQLVSLPTGAGKTLVFGMLARDLRVPTLVLAHREELLQQAKAKIRLVDPGADVGILQAGTDEGLQSRICVASVQTACRSRRLDALRERGFRLCVVDEAHHVTADSYQTILRELGFLGESKSRLLVGVTATAFRGDNVALGGTFQEVVYQRTILAMIRGGYLVDARGISVVTETDLSMVHVRGGDFAPGELAYAVNTPARNRVIVESYLANAADRRAVAFCCDVQHSRDLCETFREAGVKSAPVWGDMEGDLRKRTLEAYAAGDLRVVCNCNLLTEGWDDPGTSAVLLARPTKSKTLYVQMVGRGLRLYPGKTDCLVVDFADTVAKHDLCGLATLAGGKKIRPRSGETLTEAVERFDHAEDWKQERLGPVVQEAVDLFERSSFVWTPVAGGHFRLAAGEGRYVWLRCMDAGYQVILAGGDGGKDLLSAEPLPMGYAQGVAEDWVRIHGQGFLAKKDARWRGNRASEKQLQLLAKWGVPHDPAALSAGEASELIDLEMARLQAARDVPATHKQRWFLKHKLGLQLPDGLTKGQATRMIAEAKKQGAEPAPEEVA